MRDEADGEGEVGILGKVTLPELPRGWTWAPLGSLLSGIDAGKNFRCEERPPETGETGVVKVSAVTWGEFDEDESKTITDPARIDRRYQIRRGDLLISRANTLELVGASVIVRSIRRDLLLSDKVLRLRMPADLREWVNRFLRSHIGRRQIEALATGNQLSMRNISQANIGRIEIPLPPDADRQRIVSRIEELFSKIDAGEQAISDVRAALKRCRASVLKAALNGDLTADWRTARGDAAESGEALLARILEQRRAAWEHNELERLRAKGKLLPRSKAEWARFRERYSEPMEVDGGGFPDYRRAGSGRT